MTHVFCPYVTQHFFINDKLVVTFATNITKTNPCGKQLGTIIDIGSKTCNIDILGYFIRTFGTMSGAELINDSYAFVCAIIYNFTVSVSHCRF